MHRRLAAVGVFTVALVAASIASAAPAPAVAGKACTKAGGTAMAGATKLVCTKTGRKLLWKAATAAAPAASKPQTTAVSGSALEMKFTLSQTTVPHGTVIFTIKNTGVLPHDFSFGSLGGGTPMLQPGESATLTVQFPKAGKYTYVCTVEGHQEAGMIGALTVT